MTLNLIGWTGAGPIRLGHRLRGISLDKPSPVNQTAKRKNKLIHSDWVRKMWVRKPEDPRAHACVCVESSSSSTCPHTEQMAASDAVPTSALCSWLHAKLINGEPSSRVGVWACFDVSKPPRSPRHHLNQFRMYLGYRRKSHLQE